MRNSVGGVETLSLPMCLFGLVACAKLSQTSYVILSMDNVQTLEEAVVQQAGSTREALARQHGWSCQLRTHMRELEENLSNTTMALQRSVLQEFHLRHQLELLEGWL